MVTLGATRYPAKDNQQPWLVWLHGLLGSEKDWQGILPFFNDRCCLTMDLPAHGGSSHISIQHFAEISQYLSNTLVEHKINEYILIGYSLGGRIAAYHSCYGDTTGLRGLVLEGVHLGLNNQDERQGRLANDLAWAARFRHQPLEKTLADWYQQPVFTSLNQLEQKQLIAERMTNHGPLIADFIEATSLATQPWLVDVLNQYLRDNHLAACYLCGEQDSKFQQLATEYSLSLKLIAKAGHNAHRANPQEFSHQLISFLKEI